MSTFSPTRLIGGVLVVALVGTFLMTRGDDSETPDVTGLFADASPLEVGSEVRAAGVKVGKVANIKLDGAVARVSLDVDHAVLPVHDDAQMIIRPINLLGETYIDLVPGTPSRPALQGEIPVERTSSAVTLQDLLNSVDDPTATGLAALVSELGNGLAGSGVEAGDAIKALGPVMQQIDRLGDVLRSQNAALNELVETADPVARAVAGNEGARLDQLVEETRATLVALAAQQDGLEQTIAELPSTLVEARRALSSLDKVAAAAAPTLRKSRPVTSDLEQISDEIVEFSKYATPAFASFDGVFAEADRLIEQAAPVVRTLKGSGDDLVTTSKVARQAADELLEQHLGDLMAFVRKWALSTNGRDNISHYFRGVVHVSPAALNSLLGQELVPEVLTPGGDSDGNSDSLLPQLPGLDLGGVTGLLNNLGGNGGLLGGLLGGNRTSSSSDPTSATGLTTNQEQQLLGQLLGGLK